MFIMKNASATLQYADGALKKGAAFYLKGNHPTFSCNVTRMLK